MWLKTLNAIPESHGKPVWSKLTQSKSDTLHENCLLGTSVDDVQEVLLAPELIRNVVTIQLGICLPELTLGLIEDERVRAMLSNILTLVLSMEKMAHNLYVNTNKLIYRIPDNFMEAFDALFLLPNMITED